MRTGVRVAIRDDHRSRIPISIAIGIAISIAIGIGIGIAIGFQNEIRIGKRIGCVLIVLRIDPAMLRLAAMRRPRHPYLCPPLPQLLLQL